MRLVSLRYRSLDLLSKFRRNSISIWPLYICVPCGCYNNTLIHWCFYMKRKQYKNLASRKYILIRRYLDVARSTVFEEVTSKVNEYVVYENTLYQCVDGNNIDKNWIYCIKLWIRAVLFSPYLDPRLIHPVLNWPTLLFSYIILYI